MQTLLLVLGLLGYLTPTIRAASAGLQTGNPSLDSLENDILAGGTINNTLHLNPDNFPPLNASNSLIEIKCFSSTASPRYQRVVVDDYYGAVDQILTRGDAMHPRPWFLGRDLGQRHIWNSGRCRIAVYAITQIRTQPLPIILAAHMAALVAKECLTEAKGYLGGQARLDVPGRPLLALGAMQSGAEAVAA